MKLSYQEDLNKFTNDLLQMTKDGLVDWKGCRGNGDNFIFEFFGDNGVKYSLTYKWEFSNDSWELKMPYLNITKDGFAVNLWDFRYPAVKELGKFLLPKDFQPRGEDIHNKMSSVMTGYCKGGERVIKVSQILEEGSN